MITSATSTIAGSGLHRSGSTQQTSKGNLLSSSNGTAGTQVENKNLQCGLCLNNYQDARILPCFHSFCAECLESSCRQPGKKVDSVYCPICTEVTELNRNGIQGLPKNTYVEHLMELQGSTPFPETGCDLCIGRKVATSQCEHCKYHMCDPCTYAHKKEQKSSSHCVVALKDQTLGHTDVAPAGGIETRKKNSTGSKKTLYCTEHREEAVESYCEDCEIPACGKCSSKYHSQHQLGSLVEVNVQYSEIIRGLLLKARPLATSFEESIKSIEFLSSSIQERTHAVSEEIIDFISSQMSALQEHKRRLLLQLDAVKEQKVNSLKIQQTEMKIKLHELDSNCSVAQTALEQGIPSVAFNARSNHTATKLEQIVTSKQELSPMEDDYIKFHSHLPAEECNEFPMLGVLDAKGPSASQTTAMGEGLYEAREGKVSKFKVIVCDRYKQRRERGGDDIVASVVSSRAEGVCVTINDCKNGSYEVSYTPESRGEHHLSVLVEGKHIKGSPFVVKVLRRSRKHHGVFHCCTFCSSGGKKHIKCGCGASMPGGYSGCGHGYGGHPGCHHWSCCGNTLENSECL